ncbi:MAG: hypothetical protein JOS17DRAFT_773108 [Linnemannia elongata]|nr:MAG: hypothetical protein JOS17DRAFT_773108 [Linnemannia elongata]
MLTTEEAGVADSLATSLFPTSYASSSSGGVTGLNQNGFSGSSSYSNSNNHNNGLPMTFDSTAGSDYAFLLDAHQHDHQLHKRAREFSEEEIQAQYLDQVEEYQWSQTMALRSVLQQHQHQHQHQTQQQQQQQPQQFRQEHQAFQLGQQQIQRVDLGAHTQRSPLQQQHQQQQQQQGPHQSQTQAIQSLTSPLRHYQNQQSYPSQQQPYRDQSSGLLDAPQLGSQHGSLLRPQSLGSQQEPYQQLPQPQGQQQQHAQQQLQGYQSQYPLRSPPIESHLTQQPQRSLSAGMLTVPRGVPDHVTAPTTSSQRPVVDSSQFHLSRHQEGTQQQQLQQQQQEQRGQPFSYPDTPVSSLPPLSASIDSPLVRPSPNIPSFPYFPPAMLKYSPEVSPAPAEDTGITQEKQGTTSEQPGRNQEDNTQSPSNSKTASSGNKIFDLNSIRKNANSNTRVQPSIRALPPYRGVSQLEEAMNDLKLYDSCLFWGKTGSVNLKPEGNSWDDDMVIQSKDPAWVRNYIEPATPTNQELLILPSVAKVERSIEVYFQNAHLFPPFMTRLVVERAKQTRSNQTSRMLLNVIAGIALRLDPEIENMGIPVARKTDPVANKAQCTRYFRRAFGLMSYLDDIRSTYSTVYLQSALLLCYVYPKALLRVELLKLVSECAFLGLHVDASRWMPRPIVLQTRYWLFWGMYMFDTVQAVVRGHLSQLDDDFLETPFPALTELDTDDGLWTRWFMLKEIHLWRIGRKIHAFFQSGLKKMDQLIAAAGTETDTDGRATVFGPTFQDVLVNEFSEAELLLSLKMWKDELPMRLRPQLNNMDYVEPRVNGRALGLQLVYSMLNVLLLYPNMLAVGTYLLQPVSVIKEGTASTQDTQLQQTIQQQRQRYKHRQDLLDKINQCAHEADRIVHYAEILLHRYPERAHLSCTGAALGWCLRIYHKIIVERKVATPSKDMAQKDKTKDSTPVFSARLKGQCTVQVARVAKLLHRFDNLEHKHFYSYLTVELDSLQEHQHAIQQKLIEECLGAQTALNLSSELATSSDAAAAAQNLAMNQERLLSATGTHADAYSAAPSVEPALLQQQHQQIQQLYQQRSGNPKSHDLSTIIKKRQQMRANTGLSVQQPQPQPYPPQQHQHQHQQQQQPQQQPNSGNYAGSSFPGGAMDSYSGSAGSVPVSNTMAVNMSSGYSMPETGDYTSLMMGGGGDAGTGSVVGSGVESGSFTAMSMVGDVSGVTTSHISSAAVPQQPIYHFEYNTQSLSTPTTSVSTFASHGQGQDRQFWPLQSQSTPQQTMPVYSIGSNAFSGGTGLGFYSTADQSGSSGTSLLSSQPQMMGGSGGSAPQQYSQQPSQSHQQQYQPQQSSQSHQQIYYN